MCCFQIGFENSVVKISCTHIATRVDIHGGEGLSLVNDEIATGFQINPPTQSLGHFFVNGVQIKDRPLSFVQLQTRRRSRHEFFGKFGQQLKLFFGIDANGVGGLTDQISEHPLKQR